MKQNLNQFNTPLWVARALVERHFPDLGPEDFVIEPSCGAGAFLTALPLEVPALGIEFDRDVAERARINTGRQVIEGDFRNVILPRQPTAIIGNPPFMAKVFDGFLDRSHLILPEGGRAGFILPTYFFQTARRVCEYGDRWSLSIELMPRNAFHTRMRTPLLFALFEKNAARRLVGFVLYRECDDLHQMGKPYRELLSSYEGPIWMAVCRMALRRLGGSATLQQIYRELEANRPTRTQWWREKIRQTLRAYGEVFKPLGEGCYEVVV
jgi:site-specific DNA-methyltransferase (adenine-specific)